MARHFQKRGALHDLPDEAFLEVEWKTTADAPRPPPSRRNVEFSDSGDADERAASGIQIQQKQAKSMGMSRCVSIGEIIVAVGRSD